MQFFNRAIRILLWTDGLILTSSAMLGPIYAIYVQKIGGDMLDASLAYGAYAFSAGLITLISGKYADKFKENELIVMAGYMIIAAGYFSYASITSVTGLLVAQILIGMGEAIYSPAYDAIYSKHLDGHKSGKEWGAWESINYFTLALGAVIGGSLVTVFGFKTMFTVMGLLSLFSALFIWRLPRKVL